MPTAFNAPVSNALSRFPQAWDRAARVKVLILDVDGVLTNGQIFLGPDGKELYKAFDIQDGLGIKLLQQCGISCAVITGRNSPIVSARCTELNITHLFMGVAQKDVVLDQLLNTINLKRDQAAVMGDDWPDLATMRQAGLVACPASAHAGVKQQAHFITAQAGGNGAVRELCDLILKAQNHYEALLKKAGE